MQDKKLLLWTLIDRSEPVVCLDSLHTNSGYIGTLLRSLADQAFFVIDNHDWRRPRICLQSIWSHYTNWLYLCVEIFLGITSREEPVDGPSSASCA